MHVFGIIAGMALVAGGIVAVAVAALHARSSSGALAFLTDGDAVPARMEAAEATGVGDTAPLFERLLRPAAVRLTGRIRSLFPSRRLDRVHQQLLHAGLARTLRAEEFATLQVIIAAVGVLVAVALTVFGGGSLRLRLVGSVLLIVCAMFGPPAWLSRKVRERTNRIERDLPDVLDLLTISVEAGLGLEAAIDAASTDLESPITEELAHTLQEMNLGLSRHDALENLKERSESQDLSSFVLVLTQADVLGMPIGRVLRSQADEMRERRRARARERAAKLPVKILFPLMLFILPPLMIVVLGPAVSSIIRAFH